MSNNTQMSDIKFKHIIWEVIYVLNHKDAETLTKFGRFLECLEETGHLWKGETPFGKFDSVKIIKRIFKDYTELTWDADKKEHSLGIPAEIHLLIDSETKFIYWFEICHEGKIVNMNKDYDNFDIFQVSASWYQHIYLPTTEPDDKPAVVNQFDNHKQSYAEDKNIIDFDLAKRNRMKKRG